MSKKVDGKKFEQLTKWYLRFNGYFTVDNFIIHAADDLQRISKGVVGNYTDIDVLGLRMPFHLEQTGELEIVPHDKLHCIEKIDVVIAECKTGNQNGLNSLWSKGDTKAIEYLLKFCGLFNTEKQVKDAALELLTHLKFENDKIRIRTILFSQETPSKFWQDKQLLFISCSDIIDFLIGQRGECWVESEIGVRSIHDPWDKLINDIFKVANDVTITSESKKATVYEILE